MDHDAEPPEDARDEDVVLSEAMARALGDYERHLAAERNLSVHSVRAYVGDVADPCGTSVVGGSGRGLDQLVGLVGAQDRREGLGQTG